MKKYILLLLVAMFCHRAPEGSDQLVDIDSGVTLEPDSFSREGGRRLYEFHGDEFFGRMMEYDYLMVIYSAGDENYESVMVSLERFHEQVSEAEAI
ncbi:MAG: hypothetical protein MJY56_02825 [Bacteroidales bacterium]|nr:hypothetical protein [Bacteroidales bacterium]